MAKRAETHASTARIAVPCLPIRLLGRLIRPLVYEALRPELERKAQFRRRLWGI